MQRIVGLIFWGISVTLSLNAQFPERVQKKAMNCFLEARQALREKKTEEALEWLEKAKTYPPVFSALYLLEADIFNKQGKPKQEITAIEKAMALDSLKGHTYYFFVLADRYFDWGEYALARQYYRCYLRKDPRQQVAQQVKRQLENCAFALEALQKQQKQPVEVYLQGEHPVYWPSLDATGETLLFTEQQGEREVMFMLKDSVRYPLNFRTTGNFGAPSLTADGQRMYFSMENGRQGFDIYVSYRLAGSGWSEPVNLGAPVNMEGWEAQPAITPDGTGLYFASNRPGGRGGSDIWYSRLLRQEADGRQLWSSPRCLYFNTSGDEMAPFLYFDKRTLFFASDGYPGMGRKDIYRVDVNEVSAPLNIGITVNTQKEELGFMVDATGQWGYFSSDVSGKRCIYRYRLEERMACPPVGYVLIEVENEAGQSVVPDELTVVEVTTGDTLACGTGGRQQLLACVPVNGLLLVGAVKKGCLYYSDTLRVATTTSGDPRHYKVRLQDIRKDRTVVLKGIFFDTDDYHLTPSSDAELQQLLRFLRLNPEVKIEISGHTDNTGNREHNARLSEDRAFEVYKYLFMNRIAKQRMEYKGYGESRPVAPNTTEEGKARNRRTEIRIKE